ncbi:MAG: aspartate/glutamate racemase family protein [Granulosicoccus sp.]|nr:aspartate/glutamate racemase family protein [Granulosicoccus sp.]
MDRAANTVSGTELNTRIVDLARYAERLKPAGILYTCSAFGEGIEEAARTSSLPVLKPNEAMFDAAFGYGTNIAMIYTFPPSVDGMEKEFAAAAEKKNSAATLRSYFAEHAMDALKEGDAKNHNDIITDVAASIEADAILLAQFSMAIAAPSVRATTKIPLLTSPESAIEKMRNSVQAKQPV